MHPMLNIAVRAALKAGDTIVRHMNRYNPATATAKGHNDFVTEADIKAERDVIEIIRKSYPDHAFLAEESGKHGDNDHVWIIDPLDGTTNFMHGFPVFAVSVALRHRGELQQAVVYDPMRQELFTATRGEGAQLDGRKIRAGSARYLEHALIGTGFPNGGDDKVTARYMRQLEAVIKATAGVRRPGAAALDLAYLACGRLDGFWEYGLKPWDVAGGALLARESGAIVTSLSANSDPIESGDVLAGNARICEQLTRLLARPGVKPAA